jgi:hypothetical protein
MATEFSKKYVRVERRLPDWRSVLSKYDVRLILIEKDSPLAAELARDPHWRELYVGPVERLFQRGE